MVRHHSRGGGVGPWFAWVANGQRGLQHQGGSETPLHFTVYFDCILSREAKRRQKVRGGLTRKKEKEKRKN